MRDLQQTMAYALNMNIVFDFGNVLFEWNPARLIDEHLVSSPDSACVVDD